MKAQQRRCLVLTFASVLIILIAGGLVLVFATRRLYSNSLTLQQNFTLKFTHEIGTKNALSNVVTSPTAVHAALSLAYLGAEGETLKEIANTLGLQLREKGFKEQVANRYASSFGTRPWRKGTQIELANRIYVDEKLKIKEKFNELARKYLQTSAEVANFNEPILAADQMNTWIAAKTKKDFQYIVTIDSFAADSSLLLVNAISFEAYWEQSFAFNSTYRRNFYLFPEVTRTVDMMFAERVFKYADWPEWQAEAVELPFAKSDIVMIVILPKSIDGLWDLERKFNGNDGFGFQALSSSKFVQRKLLLSLPKFRVEFVGSLKEVLMKLGLSNIFLNANFSALLDAEGRSVALSDVIHKSSIAIDEIGINTSEAFENSLKNNPRGKQFESAYKFAVNHPFMFVIKDSDTIYFSGHVKNPTLY